MKKASTIDRNNSAKVNNNHSRNGTTVNSNGFLPNSLKFISSCIKTVSSNVKSAGASVAGSISGDSSDDFQKDQVLWSSFDRLELGSSDIRVLLIGYSNGFQVLDVDDASSVSELVSKRDDPVTFLQMQPLPEKSDEGEEGYRESHPMLLVVASDETSFPGAMHSGRDGLAEPQAGNLLNSPTAVRFYSLKSHNYVQVLRFRSTVYMVRCSPQIVAVGLESQIYCFDALTLENKFSVLTYPVPQLGGQGITGLNIGYGPMAVGPRWLAYASNNPLLSNTSRLSPQSLSPSPGVSPSTSPSSGNVVARYAMESSKQLAAGLINLGDMGYKTLSKYCHELLPDGPSSPVTSNGSWKVGRAAAHSYETDAAGTVVIKDFSARAIISQFKAHSSPISALCFDPSGTLLVTTSVHGNNINIFRIMPARLQNGSGSQLYDWSSSHVHLYKLHRGMTSAVIQDICFSHYSQWVAITSSRGTCHIFVLSPFGGETGLQLQHSRVDGPTLSPVHSMPWWSSSSFVTNQQTSPPPPAPITLSIVCRIKSGNWLHTVTNAASSGAGKVSVPSGVVAAVFHSYLCHKTQSSPSNAKALEHLLAYSPSGHLIQYELVPSVGTEQNDLTLKNGISPLVQVQEDDLGVKVEPVQWWDVCRRADWPEREEYIQDTTLGGRETAETVTDTSSFEDNDFGEKDVVKAHERTHFYLSNAEVQSRWSGRIAIWQKSKIYFYTMSLHEYEEHKYRDNSTAGETEIENIPVHEVEIKRRELLPVFDNFHRIQSNWNDDRLRSCSFDSHGSKEKFKDSAVSDSKSSLKGSVEKRTADPSRTPAVMQGLNLMDTFMSYSDVHRKLDENGGRRSGSLPHIQRSSTFPESSANIICSLEESYIVNSPSSPKSAPLSTEGAIAREIHSLNSAITLEHSNTSSSRSDVSMKLIDEGPDHEDMRDPVDFGPYFQEGYCKQSANDQSHELTETVTDIYSSNSPPHDKEKTEEDGESDGMLGGVFAFSEEG